MKIVVLVKSVPDTWGPRGLDPQTGLLDRAASEWIVDEIGERALELGLHVRESLGGEVVVLSMGPAQAGAGLRRGLSMGADTALHVLDPGLAGSDLVRTAAVLAAAIRRLGFDLVIAGSESTDGRGGVLPAMIAEHLGVPSANAIDSIEVTGERVSGERAVENGTIRVHAALPAVVSVTERAADPRFPSFRGIIAAKRKPLEVWSLADLGIGGDLPASVVVSVSEPPARGAGRKIVDTGDAGKQLAEFLVAGRLV